jgi:hypothetical protein
MPTHPAELLLFQVRTSSSAGLLTQSLNNTDNSLFLRINPNQINFAKQKAQSS